MPTDTIVHKEPAVQSNPFAKHLSEHVNAGAVAIESERAIAEAQGKLVIAKRFPRDQARAYAAIIDACKRPGLAEEACYSFPRGGEVVSGPAIRLAEMLAANWGNVDYGIRELSRKEGVSEMEAYCWDLETNTMSSQKFTVRHIRDTRGGGRALTEERDIYELTANMGARRLRARILAILPADLVQAAVDQCSKTLASGGDAPLQDRIRKMTVAFKSLGVPVGLIEKRLGHTLDVTTGEELADLTKIHNSLRDNMSSLGDWFGDGRKEADEAMPGDPVVERSPVPERKKRGSRTVTEPDAVPAQPAAPSNAPAAEARAEKPAAITPPAQETDLPEQAAAIDKMVDSLRAFLTDKEELTTSVTLKEITCISFATTPNPTLGLKAKVAGGFNGEVCFLGGAKWKDDSTTEGEPVAPWVAGGSLRLKLRGQKMKSGVVRVWADSVEEPVVAKVAAEPEEI